MRALVLLPLLVASLVAVPASAQGFSELYRSWQAAVEAEEKEEALALAKQVHALALEEGLAPRILGTTAFNLGQMERSQRNSDEAIARFRESLAHFEKAYGRDGEQLIDPLWELGLLLAARSDKESVIVLGRARTIASKTPELPSDVPLLLTLDRSDAYYRIGNMLRSRQEIESARKLLAQIDEAIRDHFAGRIAFAEGRVDLSRRRYESAAASLEEAVTRYVAANTGHEQPALVARGFLIEAYERMGQSDEATRHCVALGHALGPRESAEYMPVFRLAPVYPRSALVARQEGQVVVELTVTADGRVGDPKVVEARPGGTFDRAALDAVRTFRYAPRIENGVPVDTSGVRYIFTFELET